jgi:hypothetical protein
MNGFVDGALMSADRSRALTIFGNLLIFGTWAFFDLSRALTIFGNLIILWKPGRSSRQWPGMAIIRIIHFSVSREGTSLTTAGEIQEIYHVTVDRLT